MAITADTLRLEQNLRDTLEAITDVHTRDLVRAWATAWDEVAPDLTAVLLELLVAGEQVTRSQMLRSERLRKVLVIIAGKLDGLTATSKARIIGDLQQVIDTAGGAQASVIDSQLPPNAGELVDFDAWSRVDEKQITAIVTRSTQQITALHKPLSPQAYSAVRRELIRGVAAGSNPRAVAARMVKRAEGKFNGGLNRALVISRTEILDAHRAAAQLGQSAHADVLGGWTWGAKLDSRTCPSCWGQHGSLHSLDDPGPQDHQQGRCGRIPVVKSWADLGFDIEEPPSVLPDADAQFAGLSVADQKAILGPTRYDAWARGEFPMSDWSVKRTTDGWRDSYVPASPKAGRARSAA